MKIPTGALALFVVPFLVQAAGLAAFMHRGSTPIQACVEGTMALVPGMLFAAAYASFGCRIGVLSPERLERLHGLCFASVVIGPFAMLGVFAAATVAGSGLSSAVIGGVMFLPYLAAAMSIMVHVVSGMTGTRAATVAAALIVQSVAYAALIMLV